MTGTKSNIRYPEKGILENLRQVFEKTLSVYAYCYGRPYVKLLGPNGNEEELKYAQDAVTQDERQILVASFSDDPIENVMEGHCDLPYARCRGVAIRDSDGRCIAVWMFVGFCSELAEKEGVILPKDLRCTTEKEMDDSMPLVEQLGSMYFSLYDCEAVLRTEAMQLGETKESLDREHRRNEVLNEILELLESDQDFSGIIENILHVAGDYVNVSHACVLRKHQSSGLIDMVSEWRNTPESDRLNEQFTDLHPEELPFFNEKPYTISSDSLMPEVFSEFFKKYGISAGIFLPLEINDHVSMYVCFIMLGKPRRWVVEELRFFNSIKRVMQSILNRRMTQNSLAGSYAALDAILSSSGCGFCVSVPGKKDFLYTNEMFGRMMEDPRDLQDFCDMLDENSEENTEIEEYPAQAAKKWFHIQIAGITWVDGRKVRLATLFEITSAKLHLERVKKATYTDYLTGLYNRQRFENDFAMLVKDAIRADEGGSFLYLNLDDFNDINGGPGMKAGDAMLKETAKALLAICRSKATCYRIGGDEFGILIPYPQQDSARRFAETIRHRFEQSWNINDEEYYCTISLGVVSFPQDGKDVAELMQRAQIALSIAKKSGRGKAEFYSDADIEGNARRLEMERAMREAVEDGCEEFEVYYQPLIDASDPERKCLGAEALVRWNSRELGFVKPDQFIPMAEYLGLIIPIGTHVLYEACRHCKHWNDFGNPDFSMSVNLSVIQLMQNDILSIVDDVLKETEIDPHNLILEVTESVAIHDIRKIKTTLQALRDRGIRIALDDFGTGYSSLSRLKELPLDEIKIDKSFVDDLAEDEFSEAFVETVTNLADTINVNVVVEGVEQERQAEELDNMNVDIFQGYLFDKPLTGREFERKYMSVK